MTSRFATISSAAAQSSVYGQDPVTRWESFEAFDDAGAERQDGVHVISGPQGTQLEILLGGRPFDQSSRPVLVVFSGAVTKREERVPPFFSGRGIAQKTGVPFIAISDPVLSLAKDLNIGWYAGTQAQDIQSEIERLLRPLSLRIGKNLWMMGGSAGAFAALEMGHRLGPDCSVFVWNPQTDVIEYSPPLARSYLTRAFPSHAEQLSGGQWKQHARDVMAFYGRRRSLVEDFLPSQSPGRVLYLQSTTDWHVQKHCAPYLDGHDYQRVSSGVWARHPDQVVWLAETGQGHAPPSATTVVEMLKTLFESTETVLEEVTRWDALPLFPGRDLNLRPEDLQPLAAMLEKAFDCRVDQGSVVMTVDSIPPRFGGLRCDIAVTNEAGARTGGVNGYNVPGTWRGDLQATTGAVEIQIRDGFDHLLFRRRIILSEGGSYA